MAMTSREANHESRLRRLISAVSHSPQQSSHPSMADDSVHPSDSSSSVPESQDKQPTQTEATLQEILDTMHESDFFPRTGKDAASRFWSVYERVAKQHDDEFIERHNGEMDVLLIFAGLFSAVSSAFIVNMQSSLTPSASDTTNALLKILVNKIDNATFPPQEAALPVWNGPSSTTIWIQTLAYTGLSSSLLAAFGAVLGKQWLGQFKTSRFGRGALHERCEQRQRKLDGLESWHFSTILATLPILLQLSLLFFGIALAGNIWTLQHTVASVIMATTAFGLIFYFFTVVSSLKSPDCPFQTPVSTVLQHFLRYIVPFRTMIRQKWAGRPKTWRRFLDRLRETSRRAVYIGRDKIIRVLMHFVSYHSRLLSALRDNFLSAVNDAEAAGVVEHSISEAASEHIASFEEFDLRFLDSPKEIAQSHAVQSSAVRWIIETSTDIDNITAAVGMVPEIEWAAAEGVTDMLDRLRGHFYVCFDPTQHVLPLAQARAMACVKAIIHCSVEQRQDTPFHFYSGKGISFKDAPHLFNMDPDQTYLVVYCVVEYPVQLDMDSLPLSDRMWMAHMFTYRLHRGDNSPTFVAFLINFIDTYLNPKSPKRLVADCLLLTGMLLGLQIDRWYLAWLDKSKAIDQLRTSILDLTLGVLVGDIPGPSHDIALILLHPLLQQFYYHMTDFPPRRIFDRAVRLCFQLLEEDENRIPSWNLAGSLILFIVREQWRDSRKSFTAAQFDLLMDYHLHICEGTNHYLINATFWILEVASGLPNNPDRIRCYIDTIIRFMGEKIIRLSALRAALTIWAQIVSMGQHDESLRENFSKALASAVLLDPKKTTTADNPFKEILFFDWDRDILYLQLLCGLTKYSTWHLQLHQNGHFDNCLAIAETFLSQNATNFGYYATSVAYIFAMIDASGEETSSLFNTVRAYPRRLLVLHAWKYIFDSSRFFRRPTEYSWIWLLRTGYLESFPFLIAYARKQSNEGDESLIALVEQLCHKLDEEKQRREQGDCQYISDTSVWGEDITALSKQIRMLVDASLTDV